jgi:hypothetical protein
LSAGLSLQLAAGNRQLRHWRSFGLPKNRHQVAPKLANILDREEPQDGVFSAAERLRHAVNQPVQLIDVERLQFHLSVLLLAP